MRHLVLLETSDSLECIPTYIALVFASTGMHDTVCVYGECSCEFLLADNTRDNTFVRVSSETVFLKFRLDFECLKTDITSEVLDHCVHRFDVVVKISFSFVTGATEFTNVGTFVGV